MNETSDAIGLTVRRLDFLRVVSSWAEGVNLTHPFSPLPFIFLEELIYYQ